MTVIPEQRLREIAAELLAARKEREEYRAVVARQIEDKRRLLAERNEARAVCSLVAGNLAAWAGKREDAPESAQEHLDEAMHALVRFRPNGGYSEAASKLRLEMWHGEVYAERDAARAENERLAKQRDELIRAKTGRNPDDLLCCEGLMCGCQAVTVREYELCCADRAIAAKQPKPADDGAEDFAEQLPKGPAHGRFTDAERADLDALKRKAFEGAKPAGGA